MNKFFLVATTLILSHSALAIECPDFSGTYERKSDGFSPEIVAQDRHQIYMSGNVQPYIIDGKEQTFKGEVPPELAKDRMTYIASCTENSMTIEVTAISPTQKLDVRSRFVLTKTPNGFTEDDWNENKVFPDVPKHQSETYIQIK